MANILCDEEFIDAEYQEAHADEEGGDGGEEDLAEKLKGERAVCEEMLKALEEACPGNAPLVIDRTVVKTTEDMTALIKKGLRPKVYVVVAPSGLADFSGLAAGAMCNSKGSKSKFSVIDSSALFRKGDRSPALETPDCVPASLWLELFSDAFAKSANPMGNFLV